MLGVLQTFEILAHVIGLPGRIPGKRGDIVPISVVGIEENHGVVGSAAAQSASTRIEDAIMLFAEVLVPLLLRVLRVVPYEEIPLYCLIFRCKSVEDGDMVVLRQTGRSQLKRVTTCFKDQNSVPCLCQICRHWPTPSSGANDDVFVLRMTMECCSHVPCSLPCKGLKSLQILDESPFVIVAEARFLWQEVRTEIMASIDHEVWTCAQRQEVWHQVFEYSGGLLVASPRYFLQVSDHLDQEFSQFELICFEIQVGEQVNRCTLWDRADFHHPLTKHPEKERIRDIAPPESFFEASG